MKKIISSILILCLSTSVLAQEVITEFSNETISILNEELRKINNNIKSLDATTTTANTKYIYFIIPDDTLTVGTNRIGRIYVNFAGTIQEVHASVKTAPTGANLIVDLNLNESTIWSTQTNRVTIVATAYTGTQMTFNTATFASGDYFTIDIDQVGSTVAGAKLVVRLKLLKN